LAAAGAGAATTIIDESAAVGGSLRWRIASIADLPGAFRDLSGLPGVQLADALAERMNASRVDIATGATAWGWFEENIIGTVAASESYELQAASIVVASGSTDVMTPFAGSTLPGVMTARAVLIFLHQHRVFPGRRFAVIGSGRDADEVAMSIERASAAVVCRVDGVDDVRVSGDRRVERIEFSGETHTVDCVVAAFGRQPDAEIALQALAENMLLADAGGFVPLRGPDCETSVPRLYVVGDAAGNVRDAEAIAEGHLAGLAAAGAGADQIQLARDELAGLHDAERLATVDRLSLKVEAR
jgi:thioredoxin reductase